MASAGNERPCRWCGRPIMRAAGPGRPREFCRPACRQRDYDARRLSEAHGLDPDAVVVHREELQDLQDRLFALQAAVEDIESDLAGRPGAREYRAAVNHLLDAARPLRSVWIGPG